MGCQRETLGVGAGHRRRRSPAAAAATTARCSRYSICTCSRCAARAPVNARGGSSSPSPRHRASSCVLRLRAQLESLQGCGDQVRPMLCFPACQYHPSTVGPRATEVGCTPASLGESGRQRPSPTRGHWPWGTRVFGGHTTDSVSAHRPAAHPSLSDTSTPGLPL
jgi:hypothetical protein